MAGKGKNYYVSVADEKFKTILTKQFFSVAEANAFVKEMKEKYPPPYTVIREYY
jgi:hypothetical protein